MNKGNIVAQVLAAQENSQAADGVVRQFLPLIKSETAKFINRSPREGVDDELSIAMLAFHEAILAYDPDKGNFTSFAKLIMRNRLIDYARKENRQVQTISLASQTHEDGLTLEETLNTGHDNVAKHHDQRTAQREILEFQQVLAGYDINLTEVAESCPKQERTLQACHKVLAHARANSNLLKQLTRTKKLPLKQLALGSGVDRKTLERHRDYLVAILLAFTNGFDIIRNHLKMMAPTEGGNE